MSSSDGPRSSAAIPVTGNWATVLHGAEGLPPGLPDPAELARMAGEFFTALPESLQPPLSVAPAAPLPPGSPVSVNPHAAAPSPTPSALPGLFATIPDAQPGASRFAPDRNTAPAVSAAAPAATAPAVPGGAGAAEPSSVPAFSFLQDA